MLPSVHFSDDWYIALALQETFFLCLKREFMRGYTKIQTYRVIAMNYHAVNDIITEHQLPIASSELHGLITGTLCLTNDRQETRSVLLDTLQISPLPEVFDDLIQHTYTQLADPEFGFELFCPEEDSTNQRALAIVQWASGFISGLALITKYPLPADKQVFFQELLHDLTEICKLDTTTVTEDNENIKAIFELEEYLRLSAISLYTDHLLSRVTVAKNDDNITIH